MVPLVFNKAVLCPRSECTAPTKKIIPEEQTERILCEKAHIPALLRYVINLVETINTYLTV